MADLFTRLAARALADPPAEVRPVLAPRFPPRGTAAAPAGERPLDPAPDRSARPLRSSAFPTPRPDRSADPRLDHSVSRPTRGATEPWVLPSDGERAGLPQRDLADPAAAPPSTSGAEPRAPRRNLTENTEIEPIVPARTRARTERSVDAEPGPRPGDERPPSPPPARRASERAPDSAPPSPPAPPRRETVEPAPRPALDRPGRRESRPASPPTVRVTIGRLEVRTAAPAPPPAPAPARRPTLELEDYLKRRRGEQG